MTEAASVYGEALYALAKDENKSELMLKQLKALDESFAQEPEFLRLLSAPNLSKIERKGILDTCFKNKVDAYLLNFLKILMEKGYIRQFSNCVQVFRERYNEDHGIMPVSAVTAIPMSDGQKEKLVAILRGVPMDRIDGVVSALVRGGVKVLEFTFDHAEPDCVKANAEKIRRTVEKFGDRVLVGCGTTLTVEEVEAAHNAGACLMISPNVDEAVIRRARELDMVAMPGALTPTEIVAAYNMGADIVKLFPAGELGLGYIKAVRGPLKHIPMSAVGGVKPENVSEYLDAGVCGFGVGGPLVLAKAVKSGDDAAIEERARAFTDAIKAWEAAK